MRPLSALGRTLLRGIFALAAFAASGSLLFGQGTRIVLVHVNDTHSHLDSFGPKDAGLHGTLGGIAKAATVIGAIRAQEPNVLLLHAGDAFQGDLFFNAYFGVPELQLMQQLGFDAMAVGNHELEGGPDPLYGALAQAFSDGSFPLLSANLDLSQYQALADYISPAILKTVGGVNVGIFGLTTPDDPSTWGGPITISEDVATIAAQQTAALRASGANVVILLSHLGSLRDEAIAANVPGIDVIVGGHDHYRFDPPLSVTNPSGGQTLILQAGCHYLQIGELAFTVGNGSVHFDSYRLIPLDASVAPEPAVAGTVEALKEGIVQQFGDVYGTVVASAASEMDFTCESGMAIQDSDLGNFVTDAFRGRTHTDIALTAQGFLSEKIYPGPIVGADVFRSASYGYDEATGLGFHLVTFDIRGADLLQALEYTLAQADLNRDFVVEVSGMTYRFDSRSAPGSRLILRSTYVGNRRLSPEATYSVTSNEGVVALLGLLQIPAQNVAVLPDLEYSVIRDAMAAAGTVQCSPAGRIRDVAFGPSDGRLPPGRGGIGTPAAGPRRSAGFN